MPAVNECGVLGPSSRGEVLETPLLHLSGVGGLCQWERVRGARLQGNGCWNWGMWLEALVGCALAGFGDHVGVWWGSV